MHHLSFGRAHNYSGRSDDISVPITLRAGSNYVPVVATVDTGASFCLFGTEVAEALGLDLNSGIHLRFRTVNSSFDTYGHEVEITAFGIVTHAMVYFFANPAVEKNVLGRNGWLNQVRLGLAHHDSMIYLDQAG